MTPPDWIYPDLYDPEQAELFEGFVYLIECLPTGKKYVGKKFTRARRNGKMVESDWRRYWGSSTDLCLDLKRRGHDQFRRTILYFCLTRAATNFHETEELFTRKVLSATLPNGEREYYNRSIMGKFFVAPENHSPESIAKMSGKIRSPEHRAATVRATKGKPKSPDQQARIRLLRSKLTDDQVRAIRVSSETTRMLCERFGTNRSTIRRVKLGEAYQWVTP